MAKAIDLERFARLTAEIEHGVPAPVLLSREGIAEGTWAEAQEEWLSTLAGETAERESTDLNTRYQRAYGERLAALEREARERPPPPEAPAPKDVGPPEPDLSAPPETPEEVSPTPPAAVVLPAAMTPSTEVSPWAEDALNTAPPAERPPPVTEAPPAATPEPPRLAPVLEEKPMIDMKTMVFAAPSPDSLRSPLPFPTSNRGEAPLPPPPASLRSGLPFVAPRSAPAPETALLTPRLTLEQFAQLSAEMAASPHAQAAIAGRFGLDATRSSAEHQAWSQRFALDRGLYERFRTLYQHYAAWLASSRR